MLKILNKKYECVAILNNTGDMEKITPYFDDEYYQDLTTGAETFKFTTLGNKKQAEFLVVGNYVTFQDIDNSIRMFQIIDVEDVHEDDYLKTVYCEMASIELINEVIRPLGVINANLKSFLDTILINTDWSVGYVDEEFFEIIDFDLTEYTTVYECIQKYIVEKYNGEVAYRVEFKKNKVSKKYIDVYKERGLGFEKLFSYGKNLSSVTRKIDSSNLATALIGVGNNGLTFRNIETDYKPINQDFVEDKDAFNKWNANGSHIMSIFKAETDSEHELLKLTKKELDNRKEPRITYEMKTELLGKEIHLGSTVGITDHDLGVYLTARVTELKTSKTNPYINECVLANYKEYVSRIKDYNLNGVMESLKEFLEGLEEGVLSQAVIEDLKRYLDEIGLTKEEIDSIMANIIGDENWNTIKGEFVEKTLQSNNRYICGTLKSLIFKLPTEPKTNYNSTISFRTGVDCEPMYFYQSNLVWLNGEDCISGALLPKANTEYSINIVYNDDEKISRKYRGTVSAIHYGGKYKEFTNFTGGEKVNELCKSWYANKSKFRYATTTPMSKFANGESAIHPENVVKWKETYTDSKGNKKSNIDCSTFTNYLYRGYTYEESIYKNLNNKIALNTKYSWVSNLGRTASDQARTCVSNGWHLDIDVTNEEEWKSKLKTGDLVFWSTRMGLDSDGDGVKDSLVNRYMQVAHVAVISSPANEDGYTTTYEVSGSTKTPELDAILNRKLRDNYKEQILFFARPRKG